MEPILLTDDYPKGAAARTIPGAYWDREQRGWYLLEPTPRAAALALRIFPDLSIHKELTDARDRLAQDVRPFDNATPFNQPIQADHLREHLESEGKELYRFQELDLGYVAEVLRSHGGAYIGWERGLGKTLGTVAIIDELQPSRVLVVAPNTAKHSVWMDELSNHYDDVVVIPNIKSKRERVIASLVEKAKRGLDFIAITHYEQLDIEDKAWKKLKLDLVVADEAHRIKNPKAKKTRALKRIPTKWKLALSGSIIQNHAEELFSVLQWLFPDSYRSKWRDWNDRFLDYVDGPFGKICLGVKLDKLEDLRAELGVFMVYRRKEDELDLPPKTEQTLFVDLTEAQRRVYNELVSTCTATLDAESGEKIKAQDGLVLLGRLRQVATGLDLLAANVTDSSKLDLAADLITDSEEPTVVFSWYKQCCYTLAERLEAEGIRSHVVTGDVKHEERAKRIADFQAGDGRVFIGTISTLGESVNLQRASHAIFLDRSWNPGDNNQASDRIYRLGQDKPVTITNIIARDTVDEYRVLPVIANKEALRRLIFGGR